MKVAFIHPDAPGGEGTGATHSATRIVRLLEDLGLDVVTYCLAEPGDAARARRREHVVLGDRPFHWATRLNDRLKERASELGTMDVVHSYLPRSLPAMNHIARTTSASTVVSLNAYGAVCPKNDLRFLDREPCRDNGWLRCVSCSVATSGHGAKGRVYRSASRIGNFRLIRQSPPGALAVDGLHALSGHVKRAYVDFGFPGERIDVIPNVLDPGFLVDHRGDFSAPFDLLYVGSLEAHKGVLLLPAIMEHLLGGPNREYRLTIVGAGGERPRLVAELRARGVFDRVSVRGEVPHGDLPDIYASHDLFVYPGLWEEPFGRVLLESLAAGTPVVGTDVGAVREIVGEAGIVAEPTAEALAEAIRTTVQGPDLKRCAAACRREALRYSGEAVAPAFRRLYERVMGTS